MYECECVWLFVLVLVCDCGQIMTNTSWLKLIDWGPHNELVTCPRCTQPSPWDSWDGLQYTPVSGFEPKTFHKQREFIPTTLCFYFINCTILIKIYVHIATIFISQKNSNRLGRLVPLTKKTTNYSISFFLGQKKKMQKDSSIKVLQSFYLTKMAFRCWVVECKNLNMSEK